MLALQVLRQQVVLRLAELAVWHQIGLGQRHSATA